MKIVFAGGGTAGHIYPLIAIIRELKKLQPKGDFEFYFIGPKDKFSASLLSKEGIQVRTIIAGKIRRYFSFQNILDVFKWPIGFFQAYYHIFTISPDLIFSKGGYGTVPTIIAGWFLMAPIFLHESDVAPGLANRIANKFALEIFTSFPVEKTEYFPSRKMLSVGNPIRKELVDGSIDEAKKIFNLAWEKPIILILGGSQGAQRINEKILVALPELLADFEVIHQTGEKKFEQIKAEAGVVVDKKLIKYYHPIGFLKENELPHAYKIADLIISRAGSGSIFEIAAVGKPSILVPLPESAQRHQIKNAYVFAEKGASVVMEEENFTPYFLIERLKHLFSQPKTLKEMSKAAKEFSKPEAARIIAEYIVSYLSQ